MALAGLAMAILGYGFILAVELVGGDAPRWLYPTYGRDMRCSNGARRSR